MPNPDASIPPTPMTGIPDCDDGPAVVRKDGTREWWHNGLQHRDDGPAVEYPDGRCEWWLNDRRFMLTEAESHAFLALDPDRCRLALRFVADGADPQFALDALPLISD